MTRNKEPGKGKFHGQDLSYFIFGNKGWGWGGGGGIERINGYGHPPPPPWKDHTHYWLNSDYLTKPGIKWLAVF